MRRYLLPLLASGAALLPNLAYGRDLWAADSGDRYISLNSALKSVLLLGDQPDPLPGATATNFWRLRFDLQTVPAPWLETELAYEQRVLLEANPGSVGGGNEFLPPTRELPYRIIPLGSAPIDQEGLLYEQGFDRLAAGVRGDWGRVKVGRQAVGFGRSTFFTALDVLAPFGTFQVDQEWKGGVDALDAVYQFSNTASFGLTAAGEDGFRDGAALGRVQGYLGDFDALLLGGKRSEDMMIGLASSTQVLDAALSAELAFFKTDGRGLDSAQIGEDWVIKAVAGGSYSFDLLNGLIWVTEYHFNGFGIRDVREDPSALTNSAWIARFRRGDFQTIGRQEVATSLTLTIDENVTANGYTVISGRDGSGLGAIGGTWNYSNNLSLDLNLFGAWGRTATGGPTGLALGSEYGSTPLTVYVSLRFYD